MGVYETLLNGKSDTESIEKAINMDYEDTLRILSLKNAEVV